MARSSRIAARFLLALTLAAPLARGGEEPPAAENKVFLDAWSYSRERKTITGSNKVTARLQLKNVSDKNLEDVRVEITFQSGLGEKAAAPLTQALSTVKPNETKQVQAAAEFIPTFGAYQVLVTYRGGQEKWFSNSDVGSPQPAAPDKPAPGAAGVVVLGQEASQDRNNQLSGQVRVKNIGALEAKNVKLTVVFYGAPPAPGKKAGPPVKANKLGEWTGMLGEGKLAGGVEKNIPFVVPVPVPRGYSSFELKVTCDDISTEQAMSGGEFQNLKDVEVARLNLKRSGAKGEDLQVACEVRNGLEAPVEGLKLVLTFFTVDKGAKKKVKAHTHEVPGTLASGQIVPVAFAIAGVPKYDAFEQAVEFRKAGAAAPKAADAKFKHTKTVEVLLKEFSTQEDGTVLVVCEARNGRPADVKDVVVNAHFLKEDGTELCVVEKTLPDPMAPGETRNFVLRAARAKGYARCTTDVKFLEFKPKPPAESTPKAEEPQGQQASKEPGQ